LYLISRSKKSFDKGGGSDFFLEKKDCAWTRREESIQTGRTLETSAQGKTIFARREKIAALGRGKISYRGTRLKEAQKPLNSNQKRKAPS